MARRMVLALVTAAALLIGAAGQALAHPDGPPKHLHCLTTEAGTVHSIARGVTLRAPDDPAFHNFHNNVHLALFHPVTPQHPLGSLVADFGPTFECPQP